jgi:hypothetical protein
MVSYDRDISGSITVLGDITLLIIIVHSLELGKFLSRLPPRRQIFLDVDKRGDRGYDVR